MVLFALLAAAAPAADIGVSLWQPAVAGDLAVGRDGARGTRLDVEDDLGYDRGERTFGFDLALGTYHQLALNALAIEADGASRTTHPIRFAELDFPAGIPLRSSLEGDLFRIAYRFVSGSDTVRGGFTVGLEWIDAETDASAAGIGATRERLKAGMPVVGGLLELWPTPYLGVHASVLGGSWTWGEQSATFLDIDAGLRIRLDRFFAGAGYRFLQFDGEDDDVPLTADITIGGPSLFAGIAF